MTRCTSRYQFGNCWRVADSSTRAASSTRPSCHSISARWRYAFARSGRSSSARRSGASARLRAARAQQEQSGALQQLRLRRRDLDQRRERARRLGLAAELRARDAEDLVDLRVLRIVRLPAQRERAQLAPLAERRERFAELVVQLAVARIRAQLLLELRDALARRLVAARPAHVLALALRGTLRAAACGCATAVRRDRAPARRRDRARSAPARRPVPALRAAIAHRLRRPDRDAPPIVPPGTPPDDSADDSADHATLHAALHASVDTCHLAVLGEVRSGTAPRRRRRGGGGGAGIAFGAATPWRRSRVHRRQAAAAAAVAERIPSRWRSMRPMPPASIVRIAASARRSRPKRW